MDIFLDTRIKTHSIFESEFSQNQWEFLQNLPELVRCLSEFCVFESESLCLHSVTPFAENSSNIINDLFNPSLFCWLSGFSCPTVLKTTWNTTLFLHSNLVGQVTLQTNQWRHLYFCSGRLNASIYYQLSTLLSREQ